MLASVLANCFEEFRRGPREDLVYPMRSFTDSNFTVVVYKFIKETGKSRTAFGQANLGLTASARAPKMKWKKDEPILHV